MKNGIKSTQDLIMHLLKKKNPFQKDINNKNTNLLLNHKKNLFQHNSITKRAKYKTTKILFIKWNMRYNINKKASIFVFKKYFSSCEYK